MLRFTIKVTHTHPVTPTTEGCAVNVPQAYVPSKTCVSAPDFHPLKLCVRRWVCARGVAAALYKS